MTLLDKIKQIFQFFFRFSLIYGFLSYMCCTFIPFFIMRPKSIRNGSLCAVACREVSHLIGLKWHVRGQQNTKHDRSYIIVSNHQSSLDILAVAHVWDAIRGCSIVAKNELFYLQPGASVAWLCGVTFINRSSTEQARSELNTAMQRLKEKKINLWIFPEGARNNDGEIHKFKKGAFYLAIEHQIPILPIVVSRYYFLSIPEKQFDSGQVIITILPEISTEGLEKKDVTELMTNIRAVMIQEFQSLNKEIPMPLKNENTDKIKHEKKS